jgi:outer membrane lipoprotein-sorting protein
MESIKDGHILEDAKEILRHVGKVYANLDTYRDEGTLTVSKGPGDKPPILVNFKTYFKRPQFFRFEKTYPQRTLDSSFILWCDGKSVARQNNKYIQQLSEHFLFRNTLKDLERALSTVDEARPIGHLLFEKLGGKKLSELPNIAFIRDEQIDGEDCAHLQSLAQSGITDVWISSKNYAVRKLTEQEFVIDSQTTLKVASTVQPIRRIPVSSEYIFQKVSFNEKLEDSIFKIPAG